MKGLTLKASLRSAEMCDLAEHRSMELGGEMKEGYAKRKVWVNHIMGKMRPFRDPLARPPL